MACSLFLLQLKYLVRLRRFSALVIKVSLVGVILMVVLLPMLRPLHTFLILVVAVTEVVSLLVVVSAVFPILVLAAVFPSLAVVAVIKCMVAAVAIKVPPRSFLLTHSNLLLLCSKLAQ
jgi:hypothetical protein